MKTIKPAHGQLCKSLKENKNQLISNLIYKQNETMAMIDHNRESVTTIHQQDTDIKEAVCVLNKQVY